MTDHLHSDALVDPFADDIPTGTASHTTGITVGRPTHALVNTRTWIPLLCMIAVLASAALPWIAVRTPGSGEVHHYSLLTGAGLTTFFVFAAVPIVVGAILWAAGMRSGLVTAAVATTALNIVALTTVMIASWLSQFVPSLGLFGSKFASGRLSPGIGAALCTVAWLVLSLCALDEVSQVRGIQLVARFDKLALLVIGTVMLSDMASRVPWLRVNIAGGLTNFEIQGDGLVGSFLIGVLSWVSLIMWVLVLVLRHQGLRIAATVCSLLVGVGRLVYCTLPLLGLNVMRSLLPDGVGNQATITPLPALSVSAVVALALIGASAKAFPRQITGQRSAARVSAARLSG